MRRLLSVIGVGLGLLLGNVASASSLESRLPIYYAWAVETLFTVEPEFGHYSMRLVPWRKSPEMLLDTDGKVVSIRLAKDSLWNELEAVLRRNPSISEEDLEKRLAIVERTMTTDKCPPLAAALEGIRTAYAAPLPNSWPVYSDGPVFTLARRIDEFAGAELIARPHHNHPVTQAWFRTVAVLNACGAHIDADVPPPDAPPPQENAP